MGPEGLRQRHGDGPALGQGRVLIRPSGTEPLLRVMVEAFDAAQASRSAEQLAEAARQS